MSMVDLVGWLAAFVCSIIGLPQLVSIIRTRNTDGISLASWQILLGVACSWGIHGLLINAPNVYISNLFMALGVAAVVRLVAVNQQVGKVRRWVLPVALTAACAGLDLALGSSAFGFAVLVPAAIGIIAQTRDLVRDLDISGVSPVFLVTNALMPSLWLTWGLLAGDAAPIITGIVNGTIATANIIIYCYRRLTGRMKLTVQGADGQLVVAEPPLV